MQNQADRVADSDYPTLTITRKHVKDTESFH